MTTPTPALDLDVLIERHPLPWKVEQDESGRLLVMSRGFCLAFCSERDTARLLAAAPGMAKVIQGALHELSYVQKRLQGRTEYQREERILATALMHLKDSTP